MATQIQLTDQEQLAQVLSTKKLNPQQLNWISTILFPLLQNKYTPEKVPNAEYALTLVRSNPEIALSLFAKKQDTGTQVEGARLAFLVEEMKRDLAADLKEACPSLPDPEIANLQGIIKTLQIQETLKKIAKQKGLEETLKKSYQQDHPKQETDPTKNLQYFSQTITKAVIEGNGLLKDITPTQIKILEDKVTQVLIANPNKTITTKDAILIATVVITTNSPPQIVQKLASNNPIAEIAIELNQNIQPATPSDYQKLPDSLPHILINPDQKINLPQNPTEIPTALEIENNLKKIAQIAVIQQLEKTERGKDLTEVVNNEREKLQQKAAVNLALADTSEQIFPHIINQQNFQEFTHLARAIVPAQILPTPTNNATQTAQILEVADSHNSDISPQTVQAVGLGISLNTLAQIKEYAQNAPESKIAKLMEKNPLFFSELAKQIDNIQNTKPIPADSANNTPAQPSTYDQLRPHPNFSTPIFQQINGITNRVISFLPLKLAKPLNAIFHPFQTLKSWALKKTGQRIGTTLLKKGIVKTGTKLLQKGLIWLAEKGILAGLSATGVGAPVAVLIEIGIQIAKFAYEKVLKPLVKFALAPIMGIITDIWGKPNLKEDVPAAILGTGAAIGGAFSAIPAVFAAAGSAAFAATTAAGTTIIIASGITLIFYLAAFNMGPIIASLAQMGMPITGGVGSGIGGGTYIPDPNATYDDKGTEAGSGPNNTLCVTFSDSLYPWADDQKQELRGIISQLPSWLGEGLCTGGEVNLIYGGDKGSQGGLVVGNTMTIYDAGHNIYTLTHESGHIYAHHNDSILQQFILSGIYNSPEGFITTYTPQTNGDETPNEDFAEMIAIYHINPSMLAFQYPLHYQFMQQYIVK